jgi:glycosyltransferase involved in cell wall biosynthesis
MQDRIAGANPPGVAGLLSRDMIPAFASKGIEVKICGAGSKLYGFDVISNSLKESIDQYKPDIIYNLVAHMELGGLESYILHKGIKYVGDATHGKFIPHDSMKNFDFICQSQLLYDRLSERGFRAHLVTPFIPTYEISNVINVDYSNRKMSNSILYMHNGDKGIKESVNICREIKKKLVVTLAETSTDPVVERLGCINSDQKQALMLSCDALIYCPPSNGFIEATCTSALESLMVGLPIIGVPNNFGRKMCVFDYIEKGKIPSIICDSKEELIYAINSGELDKIDRNLVRERAKNYFSNKRSTDQYYKVFEEVITK